MTLQLNSGHGHHQRPEEASRPLYSAELLSREAQKIRAKSIHYLILRKEDPIIRLRDIEDRFAETIEEVCRDLYYNQDLAPDQVSVNFLHLLAWTRLMADPGIQGDCRAEINTARQKGTANKRGRYPAPEYQEYYKSQKDCDVKNNEMHRRLDEKKHARESQSSWDEVYASDKIGPLGGGGSLSLRGHHRPSYTLAQSATQVAADEHVWGVSLPRGRDTPAQAARDMPATETVKASLFSPLSTIQPSDFGFDDTQAWVDAQRRRSPNPAPSPHVQAGPQKPDWKHDCDELMKKFDDDDEAGDWANVGQLPKKLDSPAQAVDAEIRAPPPVVKPTKKDKGKQKLVAATPDLSRLPAKVPAPQVPAAQAETAVSEKVTAKAPEKTETPAPKKLTVKEPAMPHRGPTPAPAPKKAEAQPTEVVPSGRPAVQTVGTSSSAVKGGNQDVLFLPGEPPAPPPSAPPPADGWQ
ncbi:uncharacterized protein B0T23DRAFT_432325, partial [Neurospora hispaniola]